MWWFWFLHNGVFIVLFIACAHFRQDLLFIAVASFFFFGQAVASFL
jgi:hypothetical protein